MEINYNTLTSDQLEEYAEFVDWSLVPSKLLTEEMKKTFGSIPILNARLWIDDLLSKMVIKKDQEKLPNIVFFFIGEEWYMELELNNGGLWCNENKMWLIIKKKTRFNYTEIKTFIRNVMKQHLDVNTVIPFNVRSLNEMNDDIKQYFKNIEITPFPASVTFSNAEATDVNLNHVFPLDKE